MKFWALYPNCAWKRNIHSRMARIITDKMSIYKQEEYIQIRKKAHKREGHLSVLVTHIY